MLFFGCRSIFEKGIPMKIHLIRLILVLYGATGLSQHSTETLSDNSNTEKAISLSALSFPQGMNGEENRQFKLSYPISQNLNMQFGFMYDKSISSESVTASFRLKYYL